MSRKYDWIYFWALTDWRPIKPPEPTKCDRCGITVDPDYFYKSKTWRARQNQEANQRPKQTHRHIPKNTPRKEHT